MKKFFSSICIVVMSVLVLNFSYAIAQEAEPEAVPAAPEAPAAKKAVKKAAVKKTAAKAAAKKGETLSSLIKTFNSVHKDIEFAQKYVNPKSEEFDKTMAKALANDLLKWKKAKIQIKKLKKDKSPKLEASEEKLKELEENILAKYTESAAPAAEEAASEEKAAGEEAVAKTERGKEILEKLKNKRASEEGAEAASEEKPAEEKAPAEEKPAVKQPSKLRISPSRALYNRLETGAEATTRLTIRNQARSAYEGTVVPIENWITVNPTVVTIEPGSSIDVEVSITAPSAAKARIEGTVELRTEGESSKRIPVVVRTK